MALGFYFKPSSFTPSVYDEAIRKLEAAGAGAPAGRLHHFALESNGKIEVFDVWDSKESFEKFGETLLPIMHEVGADPGEPAVYPVRNVIMGAAKEKPTELLRHIYQVLNAGDVDGFVALLTDDFVEHESVPGLPATKDGAREFFRMYFSAFPDLHFAPGDIRSSGDTAFGRVLITGTHKGDFIGMPATGKNVTIEAIDIVRFGPDGLAQEHWGITDALAMMQQLGYAPEVVSV